MSDKGTGGKPTVSAVMLVSMLTAVVTSGLVTVGFHTLFGTYLTPSTTEVDEVQEADAQTIDVPALVEMPSETAGELVRARDLRLVVTATEASELAEGRVIRQSPLAGSTLRSGEAVEVVLSSGMAMVTVPDVTTRPVEAATTVLETLGFEVEVDSNATGGAPGTVVSTTPEAGVEAASGSTIRLSATPAGIAVPELVGTPYRRAREALESAGLALGQVRRRYDERRPDLVIVSQDPEAGTFVPAGTEIAIVIND